MDSSPCLPYIFKAKSSMSFETGHLVYGAAVVKLWAFFRAVLKKKLN